MVEQLKKGLLLCLVMMGAGSLYAQTDSLSLAADSAHPARPVMTYDIGNGEKLVYPAPKKFGFILNLPGDAASTVRAGFTRQAVKPWLVVAASTGVLLVADRAIVDGVRQFSDNIHLDPSEKNANVSVPLGGKDVALLRFPKNVNTGLYQIGQGFPSLMIGVGLFAYGKINHDYRSLSTASQLAESFILMGVGTQLLKRITGRQNPSETNSRIGKWHLFPSFSAYQNHTPNYDAFPSGHLATLMSSVTIFAENYPEKHWIKPVGYSITGLVGFAMINNQVHWASDYPLAIALGYLCARQVAKRNRTVEKSTTKHKAELHYSMAYVGHTLLPGLVYTF